MSKSVQILLGEVVAATGAAIMPTVKARLAMTTGARALCSTINYQYGHEKEISSKIASWANDPILQLSNFPLVWVREDIRYGKNGDFRTTVIPSIVIAWCTQPEYESEKREVYSFNPVLRPIYNAFLQQVSRKREFRIYDPSDLYQAQMIEHKFWGTPEDTQAKNVFKNYVDAIEIRHLELTLENNC